MKIGRSDLIMMKIITISLITSNNQRLGNAGDTDQRSKRFCSNAVLYASQNTQHLITRVEGQNARDQIALCAFHSFSVEARMNVGYVHATYA